MTCTPVTLENGARAIVCGSRQRRSRCACGGRAGLLCDWKVTSSRRPDGKARTCDTPICSRCTHSPAPGKDLCPTHRDAWLARQEHAA